MDCIFCKIVKGEIPSKKIYEDEKVFAFLDLNQSNVGHTLIIPKEHITDIKDADENLISHLFIVGRNISDKIISNIGQTGISYVINYGEAQEIKHLHLHLCPSNKSKKIVMDPDKTYELLKK